MLGRIITVTLFMSSILQVPGGAAPGQTVTDFSNLRVNYYSDLVHVQHIATPGGAAPGQTVMVLSETGLL